MKRTESLLRVVVLSVALLLGGRTAGASVDVVVPFRTLIGAATDVAIVTAIDQTTAWEDGRIYTYSHLRVDESYAGNSRSGDLVWVRTLGGVVGKVGQSVEGEAVFALGRSSLCFLRAQAVGTYSVVGRAQGQFPVVDGAPGVRRVIRNGALGGLVNHPEAAAVTASDPLDVPGLELLHGAALSQAREAVLAAWSRLHPAK